MKDEDITSLELAKEQETRERVSAEIKARKGFGWDISKEFEALFERACKLKGINEKLAKPKWRILGSKCPYCNSLLRRTKLHPPNYRWGMKYYECTNLECEYEFAKTYSTIIDVIDSAMSAAGGGG